MVSRLLSLLVIVVLAFSFCLASSFSLCLFKRFLNRFVIEAAMGEEVGVFTSEYCALEIG